MPEYGYDSPNRRQSPRINKPFTLRFQIVAGAALTSAWDMVLLKDISRTGASFTCDKALNIGTTLNLKFNFGFEQEVVQCTGKVVRVEGIPQHKIHEIGVVFKDISASANVQIQRAVLEFNLNKKSS